jgi:hypothetical protein
VALTIALEDESGDRHAVVFDEQDLLINLIRKAARKDAAHLRLLDYVDPYGDTVFNQLQMPQISRELDDLLSSTESPEARELLSSIQTLVREAQEGVHLYLRLIGD